MKKFLLVLFLFLSLSGVAFATDPKATATAISTATAAGGSAVIYNSIDPTNTFNPTVINSIGTGIGNFSPKAVIEKGAIDINNKNTNVNVNKIDIDNKNINLNVNKNVGINKQDQKQGQAQMQRQDQGQYQTQGQNNNQEISPVQSVVIEKPYAPAPAVSPPSALDFGNGKMSDVTLKFPKFALYGIKPLSGNDVIMEVLSVTANESFKKIYKTVLSDGKSVAGSRPMTTNIRYQIVEAEAQKSWTTGGSLGASGTGALGTTGVGAAGGFFPQVGGTKAHFLYTVIFVKVTD